MRDDVIPAVVLRFYLTASGTLCCRLVEVATGKSWIVPDAQSLHALLYDVVRGR